MAGRKLSDLTTTESLSNDDLVYVVDVSAAAGSKSKGITKANLAAQMSTSVASTEPVENEYADITALLADQGNQTTSFLQYVVDASDDPNIVSGEAYYEKLATSTTTLADDYRLLSDTEVTVVKDSNSYRVFRIEAIQDEGTPLTSVSGGKVSFEYSGANVTAILFNKRYTDAIAEFYGKDVSIRFHNRAANKYETEAVASTAWTTVNTDYYRAEVTGTNIQIADLSVNNRCEFFIVEASTSSTSSNTDYIPQGVDVNCVTARNALTFLTTPTSDGSDEAIHPSVVYFETAWNSYHYWMAMTPYPNSDDQEENPEILASNDGQTWVVPAGLTNPIQATPVGSTKHYSDTCLVYNPDLDKLFCFYRYSETPAVEDRVYVQSSSDGVTWSSQTAIFTGYAFAELLSPSFYYENGTYTMIVIDYTATPNELNIATSTVAESGWSTPSAMTLTNLPSGRDLWQLQISRFFNETHIFAVMCDLNTAGTNTTLHFAKTIDNDNVTFADTSFIGDGSGNWDDYLIYTGSGVYNPTKAAYEFWYSAREGSATTTAWQTGYTILKLNDCPLVEDTGTNIDLSSSNGTYYNMSSANTATTYTTFAERTGGWAVVRINAASEPTVTGATKIAGSTFASSTDMHLFIQYFGTTVQYFFAEL